MPCYAVETRDLRVAYRTKRGERVEAVRGLTLTVNPGEIVGFLGPNGAGKSSTLKALMGFVKPDAGSATLFGLSAGSPDARRRTGYLPEVAMYYPFLTPRETLRLYGQLQGLSGRPLEGEIGELLERVGISQASDKLNRSLSKGMLQRVGIAQSLLGSPRLLILDEVTSGLDPVGRRELRDLLRERQRAGATLFFSSHELAEVDMLCDRIILIHEGVLVEERRVDALKDELQEFVLVYEGPVGLIDLAVSLEPYGQGGKATFRDKEGLLQGIQRVAAAGGKVWDVVSRPGSLEEYFVDRVAQGRVAA